MFESYTYAYLIGDLVIGFPIWLLLLYLRRDLCKEMIFAGIVLGVGALIADPLFWQEYWRPEELNYYRAGLGNFFYGFFFSGIASVIYEEVFRKRVSVRKKHHHSLRLLFATIFVAGGSFLFPILILKINPIYSLIASLFIVAVIILFYRKDLIWNSLFSGFAFAAISLVGFVIYQILFPGIIQAWWFLENLSGVFILGVPLEEIVFAFTFGMAIGPMYEFLTDLKYRG